MRFGREVDDRIDFSRELVDGGRVTDVAMHEPETRVQRHCGQVLLAAGVGQLVQHRDAKLWLRLQSVANEGGADEPSSAGHQQMPQSGSAHVVSSTRDWSPSMKRSAFGFVSVRWITTSLPIRLSSVRLGASMILLLSRARG